MVYMVAPKREEATFLLPPRATSCIESTIAYFNIDHTPEYAVLIYGYVRPSHQG